MKGSIALGWLLTAVLFALLGQAIMTAVSFVVAIVFGFLTIANDHQIIKQEVIKEVFGEALEGLDE